MNKDRPPNGPAGLAWFVRLKQALMREPADNEQLVELLRIAQKKNLFDADVLAMLEGVLHVDDMQVRDIMIPRSQVVVLERDDEPQELLRQVVETGHSRFPVIGDSRDEVVGILLAKDLLRYSFEKQGGKFNVREVLRPAVFIPESKRLDVLLREFRGSRNHIAIVVDEYGGVAGMVVPAQLRPVAGRAAAQLSGCCVPGTAASKAGRHLCRYRPQGHGSCGGRQGLDRCRRYAARPPGVGTGRSTAR